MQKKISSAFSEASTATDTLRGIDLQGVTALITGCNVGLGRETARAMAAAGARVIVTARESRVAQSTVEALRQETGNESIHYALLDLASAESANEFADSVISNWPQLNILILNAGIMGVPLSHSPEQIETHMMVNYVGNMVISARLAPTLVNNAPARIVVLSSGAHKFSPIRFDDINFKKRDYDSGSGYAQSKTADSLLAVHLNKHLSGKGVTANAVHPGVVLDTSLPRNMSADELQAARDGSALDALVEAMPEVVFDEPQFYKTIPQGAATTTWAATAPELAHEGGLYLEDCQVAEVTEQIHVTRGVMPFALDETAAERLWREAETWLGQAYPL